MVTLRLYGERQQVKLYNDLVQWVAAIDVGFRTDLIRHSAATNGSFSCGRPADQTAAVSIFYSDLSSCGIRRPRNVSEFNRSKADDFAACWTDQRQRLAASDIGKWTMRTGSPFADESTHQIHQRSLMFCFASGLVGGTAWLSDVLTETRRHRGKPVQFPPIFSVSL